MHEVLLRPIEVFQTPAMPSVDGLTEKLKKQERRREEKRVRQVEANRAMRERERKRKAGEPVVDEDKEEGSSTKRAKTGAEAVEDGDEDAAFAIREEDVVDMVDDDEDADGDEDAEGDIDVDEVPPTVAEQLTTTITAPDVDPSTAPQPSTATAARRLLRTMGPGGSGLDTRINVSKALPEVRGHTSYLTFACLVPRPAGVVEKASVEAGAAGENGAHSKEEEVEAEEAPKAPAA